MTKKVHGAYWWIPEEYVLSGTYQCSISFPGESPRLDSITWILGTVWEVLALCLAVWIAVKHFLELRQYSTGKIMENCFAVLIKTHVLYFARWAHIVIIVPLFHWRVGRGSSVAVSCFNLIIYFCPTISVVCQSFTYFRMWPMVHHLYSTDLPRNFRFIMVFFKF